MAVLWLNASTTQWNDSNVWDTIEDNEIVHRAPTVGDFCYLNGYNITQQTTFVRGITVSNKENPNTGRSGGYITFAEQNSSMVVNANLENGSSQIVYSNANANFNITINGYVKGGTVQAIYRTGSNNPRGNVNIYGNVENNGAIIANAVSSNYSIYITGDVSVNGYQLTSQALTSITINGNVTCNQPLASAAVTNITINGNVTCNNYLTSSTVTNLTLNGQIISNHRMFTAAITTMSISGELVFDNGTFLTNGTNVNFNGNVKYRGREPFQLFLMTNAVNIQNPDTITFTELEGNETITHIISNWQLHNTDQYPTPANVKKDIPYAFNQLVGQYLPDYPPETVVLQGYVYDNGDKTGSMSAQAQVGCVTKEDVREGVALIGMGVVGTLVVPSVDDVRDGVVFDNGSVGTLIVQGGGDRLRIADFGYYTRSTSITYIVDLTESDKPAFADCEEIVLRSLFPTLDLDNIPDKFFDDLFVQFLRYRLLVEYYRGTSINSKFTPSEPTTEIVNYANTKCEYWLNTANLFLQLWGEKYPNSVKKDRILL